MISNSSFTPFRLAGLNLKPKERSSVRLVLGKFIYTVKRHIVWCLPGKKYTGKKQNDLFPYIWFKHSTPLFRPLKNVEMWMQTNKVENLKIAASKINTLIIQPQETFSYWKVIGNPTRAKGYKEGLQLYYGNLIPGIGGGLCQLSNLLFWMFLHSPLTVTERHRHSFDVFPDVERVLPFGSGATCSYNYVDLQCKNDTMTPLQISVKVTDTHLEGTIRAMEKTLYSYSVYEKKHWINSQPWGGYTRHNILCRIVKRDNTVIDDHYLLQNNAIMMYQPYLECRTGT